MKQILFPRYILKINSRDILSNDLNLEISFEDARNDDKIISISDSQVIRWIDAINKKNRNKEKVAYDDIKCKIKSLKKNKTDKKSKRNQYII